MDQLVKYYFSHIYANYDYFFLISQFLSNTAATVVEQVKRSKRMPTVVGGRYLFRQHEPVISSTDSQRISPHLCSFFGASPSITICLCVCVRVRLLVSFGKRDKRSSTINKHSPPTISAVAASTGH